MLLNITGKIVEKLKMFEIEKIKIASHRTSKQGSIIVNGEARGFDDAALQEHFNENPSTGLHQCGNQGESTRERLGEEGLEPSCMELVGNNEATAKVKPYST